MNARTLVRFLGWFSIGLGAAELFAARRVARGVGLRKKEGIVRLYGIRELVKGIGILASRHPKGWLWARVAGDALDLATLATARTKRDKKRAAFAAANVAAVTALDAYAARTV